MLPTYEAELREPPEGSRRQRGHSSRAERSGGKQRQAHREVQKASEDTRRRGQVHELEPGLRHMHNVRVYNYCISLINTVEKRVFYTDEI